MKKAFLLFLSLFFLLSALASCDGETPDPPEGATSGAGESGVETEQATEGGTVTLPSGALALGGEGIAPYCILYSSKSVDGSSLSAIARGLADDLSAASGGKILFRAYHENNKPDPSGFSGFLTIGEIGGETGGETAGLFRSLRFRDLRVACVGKDLSLASHTYEGYKTLCAYLKRQAKYEGGILYLPAEATDYLRAGSYLCADAKVGEKPIADYVILSDTGTKTYAEAFRTLIGECTGYDLPVIYSEVAPTQAVLSIGGAFCSAEKASTESGYRVSADGNDLCFSAVGSTGYELLLNYVRNRFAQASAKAVFDLGGLVTDGEQKPAGDVSVTTFNVLNTVFDGEVGARGKTIADLLLSSGSDFIGLQEYDYVFRASKNSLNTLLSSRYAEVTVQGISGEKIWNPIFYDKSLYTLQSSGMVDIYSASKTDGFPCYETINSSLKDGRAYFRTMVWGVLKRNSDQQLFLVSNLHFSPKDSDQKGEAAFCLVELERVEKLYPGCVVLVCGDYNSTASTHGCAEMLKNGFSDTAALAQQINKTADAIDHILTRGAAVNVSNYLTFTYSTDSTVSDHHPVLACFSVVKQEGE